MKICGLDVSKDNIVCHVLLAYPETGLASYWKKNRTKTELFPKFSSNPKNKQTKKTPFDFANLLKSEKIEAIALEPTGNHYSKLWAEIAKSLNIEIFWIGHCELKRYRSGKNLPGNGKNDEVDSLALAAYCLDPEFQLNEKIDPKFLLMKQPKEIQKLRELCQQLNHLAKIQNPIINHARQLLSWQCPELAFSRSNYLWRFLQEDFEKIPKHLLSRLKNLTDQSIAKELKIEISQFLKLHSHWIEDIQKQESLIETEIKEILENPIFRGYNEVFKTFGFGLRTHARLLSRIFPIENFLLADRNQWIEYVECDRSQNRDKEGKIKFSKKPPKRSKRNRSRDAFKLRLGMGTILEASGDGWMEKTSGSSICRMTLWQYVLCQVETGRIPNNTIGSVGSELIEYRDRLKSIISPNGDKLLNGKHIQMKLMSKTCHCLYRELIKAVKLGKI